jgi:hypothetical protein
MQLTDADRDLILNGLFAYGIANRDSAEGMNAQGLYLLLKSAKEFYFTTKQATPRICTSSRRQKRALRHPL